MMDLERVENGVREILVGIGEDPNREGLLETPARVARMYAEVLSATGESNEEIAQKFGKCFNEPNAGNIVIVRDIPAFSWCEHHMALMYDMRITVAYIPKGKVIGLSKISRIAQEVCHKLQLQERIGSDIAEIISLATGSSDVLVEITGKHSCMTSRGIKSDGATRTVTATSQEILAAFRDNR